MKPADICIAVLVAVIWGLAFVASRIALDELSPTLLTALRFTIAAAPCLVVPRPKLSWPILISISFTLFLGQFLAQSWAIALVILWVPAYQLETWHLNIAGSPILTLVIAAAAAAGVLGGGYASDWVLRDSGNIRPARQLLPGIGFLGAAVGVLAMPGQHEIETIILSTGVTLFFLTLATAPLWSLPLDISADHPAIGSLFIGLGATLAQLLGPLPLVRLTGAWWLGPTVGLPMLLAAGIAAFNLRPDLGIPDPPAPPAEPEGDEAAAAPKKPGKKH